jgi:hypothetical protein
MKTSKDFDYETATDAGTQSFCRASSKSERGPVLPKYCFSSVSLNRRKNVAPGLLAKNFRFAAAILSLLAATPALADDWPTNDWNVEPLSTDLGPAMFSLGGTADGALFTSDLGGDRAAGQLRLTPAITRSYDTGLMISLEASILAAHDDLALDRYGNDVFEKAYGKLQFGLGRFEIGQTDGAAYTLAVSGPKIDPAISIDDSEVTFFRDPQTGRAFADVFALRSETGASANFAKLSYYTPKIMGFQLGLSYTPSEGKDVMPFLSAGPDMANRQNRMWEMAATYDTQLGDATAKFSGGMTMGHNEWRTPGHEGLTDWSFGAELDYPLDEDWTISAGGAYRRSNAYAFDVNEVQANQNTGALHLSTALTWNAWSAGFEYSDGTARAQDAPTIGARGFQAALAYTINDNWQITGGWQRFDYKRDLGTFANGGQRIDMDAGFAHLRFKV